MIHKAKFNSGITLIALIITIIVLLILSMVTISMLLRDNGIITKAQIAKQKTNDAQENENNEISHLENKIEQISNGLNRNNNNQYQYIGQTLNFTYKNDGTEEGYNYYIECDLSNIVQNYKNKTMNNFIIEMTNFFVDRSDHVTNRNFQYEYKYNPENGILQVFSFGNWFYYIRPTEFKLYIN